MRRQVTVFMPIRACLAGAQAHWRRSLWRRQAVALLPCFRGGM